jgi:transposase
MMDRDEIKAVYDRGPDAVIALVESLFAIIEQQQQQIAALTERVKQLEARLNTDSHNSNQPPSQDGFKKKSRSLRQRRGKQAGAQPGHPPHTLQRVANPDQVVVHALAQCCHCQARLTDLAVRDYQTRQVFDLPAIKLQVTEHRAEIKRCPRCGQHSVADFPAAVGQAVQYGEQIKALAVYLMNYQLLPYRRTRELLADLLGQPLAEGTLQAALAEAAQQLAPLRAAIGQGVQAAEVSHFDETGFYVAGKRQWLHVAATPQLTYYAHHDKRGRQASEAIGILPRFSGIAIHDGWPSYLGYGCRHGLCNAHHLRELTFLEEEEQLGWAGKLKRLLVEMKTAVERAVAGGKSALSASQRQSFVRRYSRLLRQGLAGESQREPPESGKRGKKKQSKAKNLLDRLSQYRRETLRFMADFRVPFDNNLAERDLRMMKVQQKISGCFRSEGGAQIFCCIRSYVSTMRKQGHNVLTVLKSVFAGRPIAPALTG